MSRINIRDRSDVGKLMVLIGFITMFPLVMLIFYPEDRTQAWTFIVPGAAVAGAGVLVCIFGKNRSLELTWRENIQSSSLTVLFTWGLGFLSCAMPFYLSGHLDFIQALFESVSGWTTTGHSVVDVTETSHLFLFHRAWIQFIGGLGFVLMMLMIVQGKQAMSLFHAEGHTDNIVPNIKRTSRIIFLMFVGFATAGTIAYRIFGVPVFDGMCHSMSALSTAGFSTKAESIAYYDSVPVEIITEIMMIIGIINFAVLLLMITGKFRKALRVTEIRFGAAVIAAGIFLAAAGLYLTGEYDISESMRLSSFNVISAISTTGYATSDFGQWPAFSVGIMIVMMVIGGGIGSTAGGMKLIRVYILLKVLWVDLRKKVSSDRRIVVTSYRRAQGEVFIENPMIKEVLSFVMMYILILVIGSLALALAADCTLTEAVFDFAASLGGVGLTSGITGPDTPEPALVVEMIGMILGRLEIFIVFIGVYSFFHTLRVKIGKMLKKRA